MYWQDEKGLWYVEPCECQSARESERRLESSGLSEVIKRYRFDNFEAKNALQINMKLLAQKYVERLKSCKPDEEKPWFFIGGNPGSGKTHLCTAICGELLKNNIGVLYMPWTMESRRLKASVNDDAFDSIIGDYINASVLYIDDLLKQLYVESPVFTESDIRIAFAILNARYMMNRPTIVSTEWDLKNQLLYADQGLFSRVYERCKDFIITIPRDARNNYRFIRQEAMN